jgi:hypothetical protein
MPFGAVPQILPNTVSNLLGEFNVINHLLSYAHKSLLRDQAQFLWSVIFALTNLKFPGLINHKQMEGQTFSIE